MKNKKNIQKIIAQLQRTTESLTRRDIGDWRRAWQLAVNVETPNRKPLYDIYRDVAVDLHLAGCIAQRQGFVMARSFKLTKKDRTEDPQATEQLNATWFKNLMRYTLEANYWGHSLIEVDTRIPYCQLVPRKHVVPEYHRILRNQNDQWQQGYDYHQPAIGQNLIEVGAPDSLGLYLKAATQTIPKKNALAFWDTYAEIFGMPLRIARTMSRDDKEYKRLENMLKEMGTAGYMVAQQGTELEIVDNAKQDAFNVYDKRIQRANSEISKLIIGQTMTIEDGSSLSQSETHLKVFNNLVEEDADLIRDTVNNQLIPIMLRQGTINEQLQFEWDYSIDYTPEQQVAFEQMLLTHYDVEPSYFEEKYNIPLTTNNNHQPPTTNQQPLRPLSGNSIAARPTNPINPINPTNPTNPSSVECDATVSHRSTPTTHQPLLTPDTIKKALQNIYNKDIDITDDIEPELHKAFTRIIDKATEKGIRQAKKKPDEDFTEQLRHNNSVFAAFKTHRMQNDVAQRLLDENGILKPFKQWANDVQDIVSHQCGEWLETEYNTAILRARQAADWQQFRREQDILPNLKWLPSTSPNPGADHQPFWNTILPIDHPFWNQHRPGDRWNCKCQLINTDEPATPVPTTGNADVPVRTTPAQHTDNPQPGLENNPGNDARIFSRKHPYITQAYPGAEKAVNEAVKRAKEDIRKTRSSLPTDEYRRRTKELFNSGRFRTESGRDQYVDCSSLKSGKLCITKKKLKHLLDHTHTEKQMAAAEYIWNHPEQLHAPRKVEMEDYYRNCGMPEQIAQKKIEKKQRERKVLYYYNYEFMFNNQKWIANLEYDKKGRESIYNVIIQ